jgi:outer membrane protein OmpA-like peptidoglycan-associated protein
MKTIHYLSISLIATMLAGCGANPKNASLVDAHERYNTARNSAEVTNQAPLELKDAADTLKKADSAFQEDDDDEQTVDHLAYVASQQVGIAQETAKRKTAEIAVTNAEASRSKVQLDARTAEADSAKRQVAGDKDIIAQQAILINELNAKKTERGFMITLGDVLFRTNKAQLESGGTRNVAKLADFLNQYPDYKVLIEGYTDSTGSHDYNQELSDRRAYSVRSALVDMSINSNRIETRGYADEYPVASNATAANRQLNRRVEIVLSDANGNITER